MSWPFRNQPSYSAISLVTTVSFNVVCLRLVLHKRVPVLLIGSLVVPAELDFDVVDSLDRVLDPHNFVSFRSFFLNSAYTDVCKSANIQSSLAGLSPA